MAKKILLTISILISNRPDTVRKCLDSIQPLLNAVPSELILTDTGCGAEVRGIIEEYTDHIIDFEWCDDFSKARNVGLKQAKGEWFLFLDDDEWFEDTNEIIDFFVSGEYKKYEYAVYTQRNFLERDGSIYSDLPVGRMIRLTPKIKFIYSIHECFNIMPQSIKTLHSFVHHYGYAYETDEQAQAHANRNITLLKKEHQNSPRNAKHTLQLAQEYNTIDCLEESLKLSQEAVALDQTGPMEMDFCTNSLYANEIECYIRLGRADEAIEVGEKYLESKKLDSLTNAMICGLLAEVHVERGEAEKCLEKVRFYETVYDYTCEHGILSVGSVTTINSDCFEPRRRSIVFGYGVQAAVSIGRASEAVKWLHSIDMVSRKIFLNYDMVESILQRMIAVGTQGAGECEDGTGESGAQGLGARKTGLHKTGKSDGEVAALAEMCDTILTRRDMDIYMTKAILDKCDSGTALGVFAEVKSTVWVFALARLLRGIEQEKNAQVVWRHIGECLPYINKFHVMEALESAGYDAGEILAQIPFYIWEREVGRLMDTKEFTQWYAKLPESETLKQLSWERMKSYRQLIKAAESAEEEQNPEAAKDCLWEYQKVTVALCENIYRPEILQESIDVLQAEYQAGFIIKKMKEAMENNLLGEVVECIRQIKELLPQAASLLKPILVEVQQKAEETTAEQQATTNEMQMLSMQIKLKIRQLTQNGRIQEALAVARQLAGLMPNDTDLQAVISKLEKQCENNA